MYSLYHFVEVPYNGLPSRDCPMSRWIYCRRVSHQNKIPHVPNTYQEGTQKFFYLMALYLIINTWRYNVERHVKMINLER